MRETTSPGENSLGRIFLSARLILGTIEELCGKGGVSRLARATWGDLDSIVAGLVQQRATFDAMGQAARVSGMNAAIAQATKNAVEMLREEKTAVLAAADDAKRVLERYIPRAGRRGSLVG